MHAILSDINIIGDRLLLILAQDFSQGNIWHEIKKPMIVSVISHPGFYLERGEDSIYKILKKI